MKHIAFAFAMVLVFAAPAFAGGDGFCDYSAKLSVAYKGETKVKLQAQAQAKEKAPDKQQKIIASTRK